MKILFDPQIFWHQKFGGISRLYSELISHFLEDNLEVVCPLLAHQNLHLKEKGLFPPSDFYERLISLNFIGSSCFKQFFINQKKYALNRLSSHSASIFLPTYYDPYFLPKIGSTPIVLTVYDMIHELYPSNLDKIERKVISNKRLLMDKANKIIAISESTKNDIVRIYPDVNPEKIEVIHLSHSLKVDLTPVGLILPERYILFVGNRVGYKNFKFVIEALAPLLAADRSLVFLCAGGHSFTCEEVLHIEGLGLKDQVIQLAFQDSELASIYKGAQCFIFPSRYEGFGIPVLEAMSCGCPVVLGRHSSFPEVAGEAGIYFQLDEEEDLRSKVAEVLYNPHFRRAYRTKGPVQATKFSWERTAKEYQRVFQSVI